ncbi:MAG TPA: DUF3341 domain-containing protein [Planctomycetota bacterium]|nr:DUF3341 domain-containing protein [Planctomycetota bacterium]
MSYAAPPPSSYGMLAEFDTAEQVIDAAQKAHAEGYRHMDAYSPFPVEGLAEALGRKRTGVPAIVLIGGIIGGLAGYGLQYYCSVIDYPLNVGGRAYHSWPSFVPATFEMTVLFAALSGVIGMIALNGLPRLYHPVFNVPRFSLASHDKFFLCLEASDPKYTPEDARKFLQSLGAREVTEVPQ